MEPTPSFRARAEQRLDRSPAVFRAANRAPWVRNSEQVTKPPSRVKGVIKLQKPPVISCEAPGIRVPAF